MPRIVIADTSFLIAIQKMHLFDEIQDLYHQIYITKKIEEEFQFALPDWILIQEPLNITIQAVLSLTLDPGKPQLLH